MPATHYLEMWSDARSVDGTVSIVQPLLQPMYGGKSPHEIIATLSDRPERNGYDVVREYWQANRQRATAASGAGGQVPCPALPPVPRRAGRPGGTPRPPLAPRTARPRRSHRRPRTFEKQWRKWLHDGFIAGTAFAPRDGGPRRRLRPRQPAAAAADGVEIIFKRDASVYDGRFANNGWLQELPKPVTKLTWDNAALIAPAPPSGSASRTATC